MWNKGGNVMFSLAGKIALITGGGSGIGLVTAQRFAAAGAKVVVANRSNAIGIASEFGGEYNSGRRLG
jgi:NAD(P)-dependent dehydrogenase (short-subunit alcohol dehydrogenase family)